MKRTIQTLLALVLVGSSLAVAASAEARSRTDPSPDRAPAPDQPLLTLTVAAGPLPAQTGDLLTFTATLTNTASWPVFCGGMSEAYVHPAASFSLQSEPSVREQGLGPGQSITGSWTFRVEGPLPPAATLRVHAYGAGNPPECPGAGAERPTSFATVPLGGTPAFAPFAGWSQLVDRQYRDVLGRAPTAAESSDWVARLTAGTTTPGELVHQLRRSPDNVTHVDPAIRLYWAFFHRPPDRAGLRFWVDRRRSGTWPLVRMADHFARSSEFIRTYGQLDDRGFAARIYPDVLSRVPDPEGLDYWTRQLELKRRSRGAVMVAFSESAEGKRVHDTATDASAAHLLLLARPPTDAESTWWYRSLREGVPHRELLTELLSSPEYRDRITG